MEVLVSARYLVISSASAPVPEYNVTLLQLSSKSPISFCLLWRRFCEPFAQDRLFSIDSNIALRNLNLKIANIFIFKLISILSLTSPAVVDVLTAERTLFEKLLTVNVMEEPKFDLQKFIKNHLKFYMLNICHPHFCCFGDALPHLEYLVLLVDELHGHLNQVHHGAGADRDRVKAGAPDTENMMCNVSLQQRQNSFKINISANSARNVGIAQFCFYSFIVGSAAVVSSIYLLWVFCEESRGAVWS